MGCASTVWLMKALAATCALLLLLAGCGNEGDEQAHDPVSASQTPTESASPEPAAGETDTGETDTAEPGSEGAGQQVPDGDLPGEPMEGSPPMAGAELAVVGVAHDDVLQVRRLPDPGAETVNQGLAPLTSGVVATGRNRMVESGIWAEIEVPEGVGWSNAGYLAYLGASSDRTADAADVEPASDLATFASKVAKTLAKGMTDGEASPVVASVDGDKAVVDVIGYADDAQAGERFTITTTAADGRVGLSSVESVVICARGVTDEGLCV